MTEVGDEAAATTPIARTNVVWVGAATAVAAICSYAIVYLAARDLSAAQFSLFGVFWGALGMATGAASGLLAETTREVRSARCSEAVSDRRARPVRVSGFVGVVAAVAVASSSPWWSRQIFVEERWLSVGALSVGLAGFCVQAALLGALAGSDRWSQYGMLMVADVACRVTVAIAAFMCGWGLAGFLVASTSGAGAWLLMLITSPATRLAARQLATGGIAMFLRGTAHSITAAGASAILVMGFPVLLKATSNELGAQGGMIILAVTLTRAPLLIPLNAIQGNLIAYFVDARIRRLRALIAPALVILGIGGIGVLAAGLAGPYLLRAGFGPEYHTSGSLLAWLTGAAVAIATLALTGTATVAAALHRAYSLGWVGATLASMLLLLLPMPLESRSVIALLGGPPVGIAVHLIALARSSRRPS